jgi:oxygen-independent coproporphyrinogen-3 oxidase
VTDALPPRSLYVHVPFCAHRCGYCDFVTTSRSPELHERYVAALERELAMRAGDVPPFETVFIGGGTPTLLEPESLERLLALVRGAARDDAEITIECNPETVDAALARRLVEGGVNRVSLGAQSFDPVVLATLERRASPDVVRAAVATLRAAGVARLSLDLIWGVPGQTLESVARDLDAALALEPDHMSAYELEFKPGTRLAHAHGVDAAATLIGETGDDLYDLVIDRFEAAGWWWYETANFARVAEERCRHNLAYWHAQPWVGIGVGAVETRDGVRRTNLPNVPRWLAALEAGELPPARTEEIDAETARTERAMLAIRLDESFRVPMADMLDGIVDPAGLERIAELDLGQVTPAVDDDGVMRGSMDVRLNRRGRMLQGTVAGLLLNV